MKNIIIIIMIAYGLLSCSSDERYEGKSCRIPIGTIFDADHDYNTIIKDSAEIVLGKNPKVSSWNISKLDSNVQDIIVHFTDGESVFNSDIEAIKAAIMDEIRSQIILLGSDDK